MDKSLEPYLKEALKTTNRIYFPNVTLQNNVQTGNLYLDIVERQFFDAPPWDSVIQVKLKFPQGTEDTAYILTCEYSMVESMVNSISRGVPNATIVHYEANDLDPEATYWHDFATYGTYRNKNKVACHHGIYWVMINGEDRQIPF